MSSENKQKSLPRQCSYCNARFNDDLRQLLEEDDEPVYCELCGTEVRIHSTQEPETKKKDIKKKHKKKKSKQKRKQETYHLNPITQIGFDPEFPLIFKENLMLVLSRITYLAIKKVDDIEALKNSNRDISKELLDQLEHILEPTTWAKIKVNFLGKLHKLTINQFYEHLKQLQKKIQENEQYREHFIIFLRYIINNTFRIISEMWDVPEIPKFFHVIRKDLKDYGFDAYTKKPNSENEIVEENNDNHSENYAFAQTQKKCGYCFKILPLSAFDKYGGERGKKGGLQSYRSICKNCRVQKKSIRELSKKLKLLLEFFDGKCSKCSTSLLYLPSFEFHHQKTALKKKSWRKINHKSYKILSRWIVEERILALCGNCHLKEQAKFLNDFNDLIMKSDLFHHNQEEIEKLLDKEIMSHPKYKNYREKSKIKYQIKRWIRKRYIIEQLYNGECVACGLKIKDDLASMNFHHKDNSLNKKSRWQDLQDQDCVDILNTLINEECICLCSNCHSLLHSNYIGNFKNIMQKFLSDGEFLELNLEMARLVKNLEQSVSNFFFNIDKIKFNSPLKYDIPPNKIWKVKILEIYHLLNIKGIKSFRTKDIEIISNNNYHNAYHTISKLLEKGYLTNISPYLKDMTQNYFSFTKKGIEKVNTLMTQFKEKNTEILEKLKHIDIKMTNNKKRLENDDILLIYPKLIKKIIKKKGYNEFTVKDLAYLIERTTGNVSRIIKEILIPSKIVEVCDKHPNTKTKGSTKVYSLIDKI